MILFLVKSVFQYFVVAIAFTTTFLLGFLLLGSTDTASVYSNVYLTSLQFNQSSEFLPNIQSALNATRKGYMADMSIKIGYLSYCMTVQGNSTCTGFGTGADSRIAGVSIVPTSLEKAPQLDLVAISKSFNQVCHPNLLMTVVIVTILTMIVLCYSAIPVVPGKRVAHKVSCFMSFANLILWGLGLMLQHEAVSSAGRIIGPSSMGMLEVLKGKRADAMTWIAFTFILVIFLNTVMVLIKDLKQVDKKV
ncbi:membrane fusion mating protein FIG1 [Suhomyces tanzawaensis NRRL Y-17324]|uniref:Membrane fusion mating protein FIG1 n=1 Tax=Suhomyces tanzawaensis NRRL Y-17324 TaxID=984487 RepID=A0A1E4SQR7_9ASCO|nr:membrane fusion mating protein FIG1 [Suhomyces tanzawaensis NRRL Y-17324]ODV81838.1 membrane fusion mating protein FIG1 [Suhomyces tanzawaensis NRRL Y-17324]